MDIYWNQIFLLFFNQKVLKMYPLSRLTCVDLLQELQPRCKAECCWILTSCPKPDICTFLTPTHLWRAHLRATHSSRFGLAFFFLLPWLSGQQVMDAGRASLPTRWIFLHTQITETTGLQSFIFAARPPAVQIRRQRAPAAAFSFPFSSDICLLAPSHFSCSGPLFLSFTFSYRLCLGFPSFHTFISPSFLSRLNCPGSRRSAIWLC